VKSSVAAQPRSKKTFARLVSRLAVVAAALVSAGGATAVMATPAHADTILGGMELHSHCRNHQSIPTIGWISYAELRPEFGDLPAYQWRCVRNPGGVLQYWRIDFDSVCREQYGDNVYAGLSPDVWDARNWRCFRRD